MGILYLAALITAVGVLAVQFFSPGDGEAHADADASPSLHSPDPGRHGGDDAHGMLSVVLSLRFWTFALLAFGLVGTLLWFLQLAGALTTLMLSSVMGLGAGGTASLAFWALSRAQTSSGGEIGDMVGKLGRVLVPLSKNSRGKIRIEVRGQTHDYLAQTTDESIEVGAVVLIEEMRDGVPQVSRAPDDIVPRANRRILDVKPR